MLPSKGYFDSINCPHFDSGSCDRPHCHFRHVKRDKAEKPDEASLAKDVTTSDKSSKPDTLLKHLVTEAVKQVLSHTEVREKAEGSVDTSAIVSDVVNKLQPSIGTTSDVKPDAENASGSSLPADAPSYKPTPIAELKKRHIPVMYAPEKPSVVIRKDKKSNISIRGNVKYIPEVPDGGVALTAIYKPSPPDQINKGSEYAPGGDVGKHTYVPSKISDPSDLNDTGKTLDNKSEGKKANDNDENSIFKRTNDSGKIYYTSKECLTKSKLGNLEHILGSEFNGSRYSSSDNDKSHLSMKKECSGTKDLLSTTENKKNNTSKLNTTEISEEDELIQTETKLIGAMSLNNVESIQPKIKIEVDSKDKASVSSESIIDDNKDTKKTSVVTQVKEKKIKTSRSSESDSKSKHHRSDHQSSTKHKSHSHSKKSKYKHTHSDSKKKSSHRDKNGKHDSKKGDRHSSRHKHGKHKSRDRSNYHSSKHHSEYKRRKLSQDDSSSSDPIEVTVCDDPIVIVSSPELFGSDSEYEKVEGAGEPHNYVEPPSKKRIAHMSSEEHKTVMSWKPPEEINPTKTLCDRWRKARQAIQKIPQQGKVRISSVPNVTSLLNARDKIMKATSLSKDSREGEEEENPSPKFAQRKAHVPAIASSSRPLVEVDAESKVPIAIRQEYLGKMFDEYCKYFDPETASRKAISDERDISKRLKVTPTYKNAMVVAILRARRTKGENKGTVEPEIYTSFLIPDFTYGKTLYECFAKYLLTRHELITNGYPIEIPEKPGCAYIDQAARWSKIKQPTDSNNRICINCNRWYLVDENGIPTTENDCFYHWAKTFKTKVQGCWTARYGCCGEEIGSEPCTTGRYHICDMIDNDCLEGFVRTPPNQQLDIYAGIYAMDCEMCYTVRGSEVTRCTLVDLNGETCFNEMILPDYPILDYCTRFSGVTENSLKGVTDKLPDVQRKLLEIVNEKTILIGHSLENDLKALRILHDTVVDTSVVFPHKMGPPKKRALRHLTEEILKVKIQNKESGHDSSEDAKACLDLMMWKIKDDAKARKPRVILSLQ